MSKKNSTHRQECLAHAWCRSAHIYVVCHCNRRIIEWIV